MKGTMLPIRWLKFNAVGAMGMVTHLGLLGFFNRVLGMNYLWATTLAVEAAILHNFFWHWRWTWADRCGTRAYPMGGTLLRFNLSNGLVSLAGALLTTGILTGFMHLDPVFANVLSFVPCWLVNFFVSDRFVFASGRPAPGIRRISFPPLGTRSSNIAGALVRFASRRSAPRQS